MAAGILLILRKRLRGWWIDWTVESLLRFAGVVLLAFISIALGFIFDNPHEAKGVRRIFYRIPMKPPAPASGNHQGRNVLMVSGLFIPLLHDAWSPRFN